jgi:hypothetical protein
MRQRSRLAPSVLKAVQELLKINGLKWYSYGQLKNALGEEQTRKKGFFQKKPFLIL